MQLPGLDKSWTLHDDMMTKFIWRRSILTFWGCRKMGTLGPPNILWLIRWFPEGLDTDFLLVNLCTCIPPWFPGYPQGFYWDLSGRPRHITQIISSLEEWPRDDLKPVSWAEGRRKMAGISATFECFHQWIGLRENLQESPIIHGKIYGFL